MSHKNVKNEVENQTCFNLTTGVELRKHCSMVGSVTWNSSQFFLNVFLVGRFKLETSSNQSTQLVLNIFGYVVKLIDFSETFFGAQFFLHNLFRRGMFKRSQFRARYGKKCFKWSRIMLSVRYTQSDILSQIYSVRYTQSNILSQIYSVRFTQIYFYGI
jgi:hypothetical protein